MPYLKRKRYSRRNYRSRRTKYGNRRGRQTFQSRVKNVLNRATETKFYQIGAENANLYHDVGYGSGPTTNQIGLIFSPWSAIDKGTSSHQRIGDKITPRMMVARLWLANKNDRPNVMYRVIVARVPKIYNGVVTTNGNLDLFRTDNSGTSNGNTMCGMIDNEKGVRAYYDRIFNINQGSCYTTNSGATGWLPKEGHKLIKLKIKRKASRPILYNDVSADPVNNPICIYVIPYDSYGTLQTDNIASCAITLRLYYKDI